MDLYENINGFIEDLLHVQDVKNNKLLDVFAGNLETTFVIQRGMFENFSKYILEIIQKRIGRPANVVLKNSALVSGREQIVGMDINALDWLNAKGERDAAFLQKNFISGVYKDLAQKGTNPLYLTVGGIKWVVDTGKNEMKEVVSPVLIFPIRLIRADAGHAPVYIEFINDDVYVNPCLAVKLKQVYGEEFIKDFPHPCPKVRDLFDDVDMHELGDGEAFFARLQAFVDKCTEQTKQYGAQTVFSLDKNFVSILNYNHDEICMYYDIQKHKDKIYQNKLINGIFNQGSQIADGGEALLTQFIMPKDSTQEKIIKRVVGGQSMIIKGPPGTGKTLTITNMLASLLAENKKVLLCSKKLGALGEINAKLPEELRKFTMLLDCESEAQAAKLNPSEVRADFIELLNAKKKYAPDSSVNNALTVARKEIYDSATFLNGYKKIIFDQKDIFGGSYYEALDMLCDKHIDPVCFISPVEAYQMGMETFNALSEAVADGSVAFRKITEKAPFEKCPWMPDSRTLEGVDEQKALRLYQEMSKDSKELLSVLHTAQTECALADMDIQTAYRISRGLLTAQDVEKWVENELKKKDVSLVQQALNAYMAQGFVSETVSIADVERMKVAYPALVGEALDGGLKNKDFNLLDENLSLLKSLRQGGFALVLVKLKELEGLFARRKEAEDGFYSIIDSAISQEGLAVFGKSVEALKGYFENKRETPKLFDFKAKAWAKKLASYGYGDSLSFAEIVTAACLYHQMHTVDNEVEEVKTKISSLAKQRLTPTQFDAITLTVKRAQACAMEFDGYLSQLERTAEGVKRLMSTTFAEGEYTLSQLLSACEKRLAMECLLDAIYPFDKEATEKNGVEKAENILSLHAVMQGNLLRCEESEAAEKMRALESVLTDGRVKQPLESLRARIESFRKECFSNYFTRRFARPSFADLQILVDTATDRNVLGGVTTYLSVINGKHALPLKEFFAAFERGEVEEGEPIEVVFKHSLYYLAMEYKLYAMGDMRNGLGEKASQAFDEFTTAETKEQALTVKHIERMCMGRINEKDPSFAFLNSQKSVGETLRLLFKKNAEGIIKLKRCFLLSPSTASVLLSHPAFFDFDVVICDEASQLEPIAMLPLLVRARQIVLVGDEWQMPPIKRGVARVEKHVDEGDGDYTVLSPDISALSLALKNRALPTAELVCHYRSNTESLIAFSREKFYPFMHTFPSVMPKGEGVGLFDVFVKEGRCEEGANLAEAKEVISLIKTHFEKYYDKQTQVLSQSLGVVGFGEKQVKLILTLLGGEKELSSQIEQAKLHFEDEVKEKLIFFKPIDKVQGQEIQHLILSLTYGKNKEGKIVNAFGELNRGDKGDKLGQCIFNVAVTRAKSSVTVVRSIHSYDITTPSVSYIAEYLKQVERFKEDGSAQFVGKRFNEVDGFLKEIASLLIAEGIKESRIVINYGATKGSIRIPLVILDKEERRAQFAIWCEVPTSNTYDYLDYNVKYYEILKTRGWSFVRVFIHDWFHNYAAERQKLIHAIKNNVEI